MQGLKGVIVIATIVAATVALGGCFHHDQAVATTPLKLGSAGRGRADCSRLIARLREILSAGGELPQLQDKDAREPKRMRRHPRHPFLF